MKQPINAALKSRLIRTLYSMYCISKLSLKQALFTQALKIPKHIYINSITLWSYSTLLPYID